MYKIGVTGDDGSIISELRHLLSCLNMDSTVEPPMTGKVYDILLVHEPPENGGYLTASGNTIVLNSDESGSVDLFLRDIHPRLIVTYGFNSKASITASSVFEGTCCICVQRAFTTNSGVQRERQELTVLTRNPWVTLAAVAAVLATDIEATELKNLGMLVPVPMK